MSSLGVRLLVDLDLLDFRDGDDGEELEKDQEEHAKEAEAAGHDPELGPGGRVHAPDSWVGASKALKVMPLG